MKKLSTFFTLIFIPVFALIAQSGFQKKQEKEIQEEDIIAQGLDSMDAHYGFTYPTSSLYDTLILNTYNFRSDDVPTYSDDILKQRLMEIPAVISMDYNIYVKRFIDLYTLQRREQVSRMLGLSNIYFPIFEEALDREGMPIELKYLAVVESALNPHARSRVGATGLWQFMLPTARMYGLSVNSLVDERKNPYKSTEAALKYLKGAYDEYGDWLLAIASYNCGPGNVRKAIRRSGGKKNFWAIRRYLPRETRGYVPAFIAATYVFHYASEHNLYPIYVNFDYKSDTIHIRKLDISLNSIASMTQTRLDVLRQLNPELMRNRIPYSSKTYALRVPRRVSDYFIENDYTIRSKYGRKGAAYAKNSSSSKSSNYSSSFSSTPYNPGNGRLRYHVVKEGEVVGAIAEAYGVSTRNISYWNNLRGYRIRVGQKLKIYSNKTPKPVKVTPTQPVTKSTSSSAVIPAGPGTYHTVKRGDTIWNIARAYQGTTAQSIINLNKGIDVKDLKVGQRIRVK